MPARPQAKKPQRSPAGGGRAPSPPWRGLFLGAVILASALLPNWKSLDYGFVWDDPFVIGPHLDVKGWSDVVELWNTPFDFLLHDQQMKRNFFRPVTFLSLAADRAAWGESPRGFHAQNLLWYALTCLFLWLLAWELSGRPLAATAGAVLFALHPAHPESVCFIAGRTDVIAGAFLFASLWAAARLGPRIRSPWRKLAPAALLLLPGLYAKEVALLGAPLVPIALWLRDRRVDARTLARASTSIAAVVLLYLATRLFVLGSSPLPAIAPVAGAVPQILTSVAVVARYLPLLFFPVALSARHEIVETHAPDAVFWAGLATLAAIAAGIVLLARRRSPWLLPLALFAATLLPICYVRLLSGAIVAERFLFVPSAALALAVALLPGATARRERREGADPAGRDAGWGLFLAAAAAAIWFLTLLAPRVAIWRDEGTLFASMLRDSPESPHVHSILGGYYYRQRDLPRAAYHFRRSHQLYPQSGEVLLNLGAAEDEMGATDSAFVHVRALNRLDPRYAPGWYALGNLFVRIDEPDSARAAYERAIALQPDMAHAENNLGAVLERLGRFDEALAHYRRAGEILPGYPEATNNLRRLTAERDSLGAAPRGGAGAGATPKAGAGPGGSATGR